jgi:hypothetical protein
MRFKIAHQKPLKSALAASLLIGFPKKYRKNFLGRGKATMQVGDLIF